MGPKVSIVMPVYNQEKYIKDTLVTLLNQTFKDFELIIINDGSNDKTFNVISSFKDPRLKLINNQKNKGLVYSLNRGLKESTGKYIARADGDDVYLPKRLELQVDFLDTHPDYVIVGCDALRIDENGKEQGVIDHPENDREIRLQVIKWSNVLLHPAVMFRREIIIKIRGYRPLFTKGAEDYDLWFRILRKGKAHNIKKRLIKRRFFTQTYSQKYHLRIEFMALVARIINLPNYILANTNL